MNINILIINFFNKFIFINLGYLIPSYIINLISEDISPNKSSDGKIYSYNIDNKAISLYLSDKDIEKIVALDNNITYSLEYAVIK